MRFSYNTNLKCTVHIRETNIKMNKINNMKVCFTVLDVRKLIIFFDI